MVLSNHPTINSTEFENYLKKENIQLVFTAVDTLSSNGFNERFNQTLVNKMRY